MKRLVRDICIRIYAQSTLCVYIPGEELFGLICVKPGPAAPPCCPEKSEPPWGYKIQLLAIYQK